jgi:hypothetical protein
MNRVGQRARLRFAQQQVDVFGHDDISVHAHLEVFSHSFETEGKQLVGLAVVEERLSAVTTESDEMG